MSWPCIGKEDISSTFLCLASGTVLLESKCGPHQVPNVFQHQRASFLSIAGRWACRLTVTLWREATLSLKPVHYKLSSLCGDPGGSHIKL